ncbi:MAG: FKBP-type peptidyl-prolyl cis-trans isomerase [Gammaproteobacteria bacterium]|nr:FKBP-type peptidyl-prolyl cis-trans isomerase [Gammaproteobacteria bacterium]
MNFKLRLICLAALAAIAACGKSENKATDMAPPENAAGAATQEISSSAESIEIMPGLTMRTLRAGSGAIAKTGDIAIVHYTGWLFDEQAADHRGKKFDSSVDRDQHFQFKLGEGRVIQGWDQGVVGMKEGEIRELTIAPEMAYGDRNVGNGLIPPGSTLVFEVELARAQAVNPDINLPGAPE